MGDLNHYLQQALDASDRLTLASFQQAHIYHAKGERDFALAVDLQVEKEVKRILAGSGIPVLGEEFAWQGQAESECFWVVDPVDGTINYARQLPMFGTCIALVEQGSAVLAGISLPLLNERYLAQKGGGATLNQQAIHVANTSSMQQALVGMGDFAVGWSDSALKNQTRFAVLQSIVPHVLRVRCLGSAAVQLAWLAAGKLDISLILSNNAWDVQAGVLIVREAGGEVYDLDGSEHSISSRYTLASLPNLKQGVLGMISTV